MYFTLNIVCFLSSRNNQIPSWLLFSGCLIETVKYMRAKPEEFTRSLTAIIKY